MKKGMLKFLTHYNKSSQLYIQFSKHWQDNKYTCVPEDVKYGPTEDIGNVCHCYTEKCNIEVPALSTSSVATTSVTTSSSTPLMINITMLFAMLCFVNL